VLILKRNKMTLGSQLRYQLLKRQLVFSPRKEKQTYYIRNKKYQRGVLNCHIQQYPERSHTTKNNQFEYCICSSHKQNLSCNRKDIVSDSNGALTSPCQHKKTADYNYNHSDYHKCCRTKRKHPPLLLIPLPGPKWLVDIYKKKGKQGCK